MFRDALTNFSGLESPFQVPNAAGLARLRLVPVPWILRLDLSVAVDQALPARSLILKAGLKPKEITFAYDTGSYSAELSNDVNGFFYLQKVGFRIGYDRPSVIAWLDAYAKVPFIALYKDRNSESRLVGSLDQPLRFESASIGHAGKGGRNERAFLLSASSELPAFGLPGIDDAQILDRPRTFSKSFNLSFT